MLEYIAPRMAGIIVFTTAACFWIYSVRNRK